MHNIYLPVIDYTNFDTLSKVLQFLHYKGEEFFKGFLWRQLLVGLNLAPLPMRSRYVISSSPRVKRERLQVAKPKVCPLNLSGHRLLMSDSFSGNLEIKRRAGLLLGSRAGESI